MLKKYFLLLSVLETDTDTETVLLKICVETIDIFFRFYWVYKLKEKYLFGIQIFCNFVNVFIVTNPEKLSMNFFKMILLTPNFWTVGVNPFV